MSFELYEDASGGPRGQILKKLGCYGCISRWNLKMRVSLESR